MRSLRLLALLACFVGCGGHDDSSNQIKPFGSILSPTTPPVSLTSLTASVPGTENGQTLGWNGSAWVVDDYCSDPSLALCATEEFTNIVDYFSYGNSGAGTSTTISGEIGHPGILQMIQGTTAAGVVRFNGQPNTVVFDTAANFAACAKELVRIPTLCNSTDQCVIRVGFTDAIASTSTNGVDAVQMVYDNATSGDFWEAESRSNSVSTVQKLDGTGGSTSTPVTAGTWITLAECVTADGATATARFYANGTQVFSTTTNVPTGNARASGIGMQSIKTVGTTSRQADIDYFKWRLPFPSAR